MKGKGIKGAIAASALSAVLCAGMLAGTTFAWFTDTVTSSGNRIMAGNLDISATVAEYVTEGEDVSYMVGEETYGFGKATPRTGQAILNEEGWQPGDWNAKLLTVENDGSLAAYVQLTFVVQDEGLADVLWYDFIGVDGDAVTGKLTRRGMNTLEAFGAATEIPLEAGESVSYIFIYGMEEEADNRYQGKNFNVDAYILARQQTEGAEYEDVPVYENTVYVTPETLSGIGAYKDNTTYYFEAGNYNTLGCYLHGAENVSLIALGDVVVNGNMTVGYHSNHDKNDPVKTASTIAVSGFTVNGNLAVSVADSRAIIKNNTVNGQLTVTMWRLDGMDICLEQNVIDGSEPGAQGYGIYIVPEVTDYNLTVRGNTFRNIESHAFAIQGVGQGASITAAGSIAVEKNVFASWGTGNKENRAAFKIWGDTKYAPESISSTDELTAEARLLVDSILNGENQFLSEAANTVLFNFFDCSFNSLS